MTRPAAVGDWLGRRATLSPSAPAIVDLAGPGPARSRAHDGHAPLERERAAPRVTPASRRADVCCNLPWSLPFADASVAHAYFAMAIEHFEREHVPLILREIRRVLRPDGVLRIVTLDMEAHARAYVDEGRPFFAVQAEHWPWTRALRTPLEHVLAWPR
jgi:SAM-dependent methyltransferase